MNTRPNQLAFGGEFRRPSPATDELLSAAFLLDILRRRWKISLMICLAGLSSAGIYVVSARPRFTAASTLLIDTKMQPPQPAQAGQASAEVIIDPGVIESQIEILRSNKIAFDVIDTLGLAKDPEFVPPRPGVIGRLRGEATWLLGLDAGAGPPPDPRQIAAAAFAEKVRIARSGRSFLAEITATTLDADKSARIANAVADSYIQDQLGNRMEASQRTIAWMRHRLADIKAQADAAERALQDFRTRNAPCSSPTCPPQSAPRAASASGETGAHEQELALAATMARNTYEALENRVAHVSVFMQQEALPVTEARVVNLALPPSDKSVPKSGVILLLGLVGGLVAGASAAFLRETSDRRLRWPMQITRTLNQNYLGAFPPAGGRHASFAGTHLAPRRPGRLGAELPLLVAGRAQSLPVQDALNAAKFLVDQVAEHGQCPVVGIISAGRREGKSTLAVNFAALSAQMGARVLVIDADLRAAGLSRALHNEAGRGLAEAAQGSLRLAECVTGTVHGFDLLPAFSEAPPAHPLGILASQRVRDLLAEARNAYDYVLIDVPAVLHGMEVRPLLNEIDAFIVTAQAGTTTLDDIQRVFAGCPAIEELAVGVILNRSRLSVRHMIVRTSRLIKMAA